MLCSCSIQKRVKKADKKYEIGEYYDAAQIYKQCNKRINAKKQRELKAHVSFRQGECCRILNDTKAVSAYAAAIKYKYPDSIVYLRHAEALMYQGKYKDAEKSFGFPFQGFDIRFQVSGPVLTVTEILPL